MGTPSLVAVAPPRHHRPPRSRAPTAQAARVQRRRNVGGTSVASPGVHRRVMSRTVAGRFHVTADALLDRRATRPADPAPTLRRTARLLVVDPAAIVRF